MVSEDFKPLRAAVKFSANTTWLLFYLFAKIFCCLGADKVQFLAGCIIPTKFLLSHSVTRTAELCDQTSGRWVGKDNGNIVNKSRTGEV